MIDTNLLKIIYDSNGLIESVEYSERFKRLTTAEQESILNYVLSMEDQMAVSEMGISPISCLEKEN